MCRMQTTIMEFNLCPAACFSGLVNPKYASSLADYYGMRLRSLLIVYAALPAVVPTRLHGRG